MILLISIIKNEIAWPEKHACVVTLVVDTLVVDTLVVDTLLVDTLSRI